MQVCRLPLVAVLLLSLCGSLSAAELRLKPQARCNSSVVRLGDVADVFSAEKWQIDQLSAIELGPAPTAGTKRFIRAREVQDALWMRGVNLSLHQFSGVDRIEVNGPGEPVVVVEKPKARLDQGSRERANRQVVEAVTKCLQRQTGGEDPWKVVVELSEEQASLLTETPGRIVAEGGLAPWTGSQSFSIRAEDGNEKVRFVVETEVTLPPVVVTLVRSVPAGTILHAADLVLKPVVGFNQNMQPFHRIEDVVGQETTWAVPAGTILGRSSLRRPLVVRRGDAVTLYARSAGLRVRTTVRAREDGGLGDLIAVESFSSREPFYARVTGIQEVEIYAAPAEASPKKAATTGMLGTPAATQGAVR